jgi:hypothetical protein
MLIFFIFLNVLNVTYFSNICCHVTYQYPALNAASCVISRGTFELKDINLTHRSTFSGTKFTPDCSRFRNPNVRINGGSHSPGTWRKRKCYSGVNIQYLAFFMPCSPARQDIHTPLLKNSLYSALCFLRSFIPSFPFHPTPYSTLSYLKVTVFHYSTFTTAVYNQNNFLLVNAQHTSL